MNRLRRLTPVPVKSWFRERRKHHAFAKIAAVLDGPLNLYVGCGYVRFDGWIHLDRDPKAKPDLVWDVAWGLPIPDATADVIYSEHFLEHLPLDMAVTFLSECFRCLRPGGTIRTAMPSLDALLASRTSVNWKSEFEFLEWPHYATVATHAELMNIVFRHFEHAWIYDSEELNRRLRDAGFVTIRGAEWGRSGIPCLNGLETRSDSRLILEATK